MNTHGITLYLVLLCSAIFTLAACRDDERGITPLARREAERPNPRPEASEGDGPFANAIAVDAGCSDDPLRMAVARFHPSETLCETITMTPLAVFGGEQKTVSLPFVWIVHDDRILELDCVPDAEMERCWLRARKDIFDSPTNTEPMTEVTGCAMNTCPDNRPYCEPLECATVEVAVTVNLEDVWRFEGTRFESREPYSITQDGRAFKDAGRGLHGHIEGEDVTFTMDDTIFLGEIKPDRASMEGDAVDLMTFEWLGPWSATRVMP